MGSGDKGYINLHLVLRSRKVELYLHSPMCLHEILLNCFYLTVNDSYLRILIIFSV
jgi:hypothetical protein